MTTTTSDPAPMVPDHPGVPPTEIDVRPLAALAKSRPRWTPILLDQLERRPAKPKAHDTWTRVSSSGHCSRQITLAAIGAPVTNPMSGASILITLIGEFVHELLQEAIETHLEESKVAVEFVVLSTNEDLTSGHLDVLVIFDDNTAVIVEIKTMGGKKFRRRVDKPATKYRPPETGGPVAEANVFQLAVQLSLVEDQHPDLTVTEAWLVNIGTEQLTIYEADRWDLGKVDRICHEYVFTDDLFDGNGDLDDLRALARWELWRQAALRYLAEVERVIPKPMIPEEGPGAFVSQPSGSQFRAGPGKPQQWWWGCDHCDFQTLCSNLPATRCSIDTDLPRAINGLYLNGVLTPPPDFLSDLTQQAVTYDTESTATP